MSAYHLIGIHLSIIVRDSDTFYTIYYYIYATRELQTEHLHQR